MPDYPLWWSKPYRKKSLEQVALTDYPYLTWSEANIRKLNDAYRARIADIRQKLNNYTPSVVCDRCSEPAGVLSIVRYASGFMNEWCVTGDYFYCTSNNCRPVSDSQGSSFVLLPLKFDSILGIRYSRAAPKSFFKQLHEVFRRSAGWPAGRKVTEKTAADFIKSL